MIFFILFVVSFFKNLGKFLKKLGPVVPIATWTCYFIPNFVHGHWLSFFYAAFVMTTFAYCFLKETPLLKKVAHGRYQNPTTDKQKIQTKIQLVVDAFCIGLIAYSLLNFSSILLFKLPTVTLVDLITNRAKPSIYTVLILLSSVGMSVLRYKQKRASREWKAYTHHLKNQRSHDTYSLVRELNSIKDNIQTKAHVLTRLACDCMIVFYNLFFVVLSLLMLFFGAHINVNIFQTYFIWKMVGLSSLCTAKISLANQKGSEDYMYHKIAKITDLSWDSESQAFTTNKEIEDDQEEVRSSESDSSTWFSWQRD